MAQCVTCWLLAASMMFPALLAASAQEPVLIDRIRIAVNDKALTRREVAEIKRLRIQEIKSEHKGRELEEKLKRVEEDLTDELIEDLLLEIHAERMNIEISDKAIEERVDNILRRDPAMAGIYSEDQLKSFIVKDLLRRRVLSREVDSRIRITNADILAACRKQSRDGREVEVGHILIRESEPDALRKINAVREQLEQGADFEQMALTHSQDPSVSGNKGRLGFISRGQFVKPFEDKAFSLPVGALSEPVRTRFGWHLVKVFGERVKARLDCDDLDDVTRQSFRNQVFAKRREERLKQFLSGLRKKADIRVIN